MNLDHDDSPVWCMVVPELRIDYESWTTYFLLTHAWLEWCWLSPLEVGNVCEESMFMKAHPGLSGLTNASLWVRQPECSQHAENPRLEFSLHRAHCKNAELSFKPWKALYAHLCNGCSWEASSTRTVPMKLPLEQWFSTCGHDPFA